MERTQPTLLNRLSFALMVLLLAVFCFSVVSVVAASADDQTKMAAKRDSGSGHDGDEDEDDDDNSGPGSGDGHDNSGPGSGDDGDTGVFDPRDLDGGCSTARHQPAPFSSVSTPPGRWCPIRSRLVRRYRRLCSVGSIEMLRRSTTSMP